MEASKDNKIICNIHIKAVAPFRFCAMSNELIIGARYFNDLHPFGAKLFKFFLDFHPFGASIFLPKAFYMGSTCFFKKCIDLRQSKVNKFECPYGNTEKQNKKKLFTLNHYRAEPTSP